MAVQKVNIGAAPNDGSGDSLRLAFQKMNNNADELTAALTGISEVDAATQPAAVRDSLQSLTGENRLAAASVKDAAVTSNSSATGPAVNGFSLGARGSMNIRNARKIKRALAKLSLSTTQRINIGIHGMSIPFGWGVDGVSTYPQPASAKTNSVASILGKSLNQEFGGTFTPGIDVIDNQSGIFTIAGGAGYPDIYTGPGPNGVVANPGAGTVTFNVLGGRAGQVVRIYAVATTAVAVNAVYSLTGANSATDTQTASSVPAGNMLPNNTQHWFEYTIPLASAGDTAVILKNAAPASTGVIGNNLLQIWGVDMDYRTDPGITVHRLCKPGRSLVQTCAWPLDDTDVWPVGPNPATDWIGSDTATQNRRAANLQSMVTRPALDMAICWFDINDVFYGPTGGFSEADHRRHIQNYVNGVTGLGVPVLFIAGIFRNPASVTPTQGQFTQEQMIGFYRDASDASPSVAGAAFLDLSQNLLSTTLVTKYIEEWADTTFRVPGEGENPLHPNKLFSAFIGQAIGASLMQAKNAV